MEEKEKRNFRERIFTSLRRSLEWKQMRETRANEQARVQVLFGPIWHENTRSKSDCSGVALRIYRPTTR